MKIITFILLVVVSSFPLIGGCSKNATASEMPVIPAAYYACVQVNPDDLMNAYFLHYFNESQAEQAYNGMIFVFKNITVNQYMLIDSDTLDVGTIECDALVPGAVSDVKSGDIIDIVGVCQGPLPGASTYSEEGMYGWLLFTGCIFLPAGSVNLPAQGGSTFAGAY